jgi:hypothetical protein
VVRLCPNMVPLDAIILMLTKKAKGVMDVIWFIPKWWARNNTVALF